MGFCRAGGGEWWKSYLPPQLISVFRGPLLLYEIANKYHFISGLDPSLLKKTFKPMTKDALRSSLKDLKWSGLELGTRVEVAPSTVYNWLHGRRRIPGAVKAYVTLALDFKRMGDSLGRGKKD